MPQRQWQRDGQRPRNAAITAREINSKLGGTSSGTNRADDNEVASIAIDVENAAHNIPIRRVHLNRFNAEESACFGLLN